MWNMVWVIHLSGLLFSLSLMLGIVGFFVQRFGRLWPFVTLFFLYVVSALLTWQAMYAMRWLPIAVMVSLFVMAVLGWPSLIRTFRKFFREQVIGEISGFDRWTKCVLVLLAVAFVIEIFFSAFPEHRYDQWTYHLVIPKLISLYGSLPPYLGTDHTHFSGSWEYFFTTFRVFPFNDVVIQSATTCFTFLSYLIPASAFIWQIVLPQRFFSLWLLGIPAMVIYVHTELEPVVSAKPDFVNVAAAVSLVAAQKLAWLPRVFFTVFFLVAGLSFKVTWLHAGAALVCALAWIVVREIKENGIQQIRSAFVPIVLALLAVSFCLAPVFTKNIHFFGNPIHPTQLGPFHSVTVTESFKNYWATVAAPRGMSELSSNTVRVIPQFIKYYWPLFISMGFVGCVLWRREGKWPGAMREMSPWILGLLVYLVLWGVLFPFSIFNRFVAVASVFPLLGASVLVARLQSSKLIALAFGVPLVLSGAQEVKVKRMVKAAALHYEDYSKKYVSPELQIFRESNLVEAHAQGLYGTNWREHCNILSSKNVQYFFNSRIALFNDHNSELHIHKFGQERYLKCPWAYFKSINICYLIATPETDFSRWPEPVKALAELADSDLAQGKYQDLLVRYISPQTLAQKINSTLGCQ